ncbi:MAG: methyltransferase domain-containing protein, partial [Geminicoccaceae bacterium]|nr:methyltransferase domain-containing protein [Geminicoccaceae bacterium]
EGAVRPGQRLLDLGTGTGSLARGFARMGLEVTGLDVRETMLDEARHIDRQAGVIVRYLRAPAEASGLAGESFDVVSAGQCWHWFDRPRVAAEVHRLLVPDGRVLIAHFDWIPLAGNVVEASERLIRAHNPGWTLHGGTGLHPAWLADLALAGFKDLETFSFDLDVPYRHDAWRGRIRASAGVGASLDEAAVRRFDDEHGAMLADRFPDEPLAVPHRCWAVHGRKA